MVLVPFKEEFAADVESGEKRQTIRLAKCTVETGRCVMPFSWESGKCFGECKGYTFRIKPGDTLQLYTGLRQRKYCKDRGSVFYKTNVEKNPERCSHDLKTITKCGDCKRRGAKLLKEATCTESFPIKFEDLTEEIAKLDGFKAGKSPSKDINVIWTPLQHLRYFLITQYDAKDGDVFQIVRW
jgi:hypothetical protein